MPLPLSQHGQFYSPSRMSVALRGFDLSGERFTVEQLFNSTHCQRQDGDVTDVQCVCIFKHKMILCRTFKET